MDKCPACDMSKVKKEKQTAIEWVDMHLELNGPTDGKCPSGTYKRIFFGETSKLDKCCCESKDSPFL